MRPARCHTELLNLDILALSLLCCLLASVVGVLVLGGEEKPQANDTLKNPRAWTDLRQRSSRLYVQVQESEHAREGIVAKLNYSMIERENHALETRISLLERKIQLINRLGAANAEAQRLRSDQEEREKAQAAIPLEKRKMLGEYKGPYVLIECVENGAIVYPGGERLELKPSAEEAAKLVQMIKKAGFVAFAVRPAGWYGNSYDKLKALLYKELDAAESERGQFTGRTSLPLDTSESIKNYLPVEVHQ